MNIVNIFKYFSVPLREFETQSLRKIALTEGISLKGIWKAGSVDDRYRDADVDTCVGVIITHESKTHNSIYDGEMEDELSVKMAVVLKRYALEQVVHRLLFEDAFAYIDTHSVQSELLLGELVIFFNRRNVAQSVTASINDIAYINVYHLRGDCSESLKNSEIAAVHSSKFGIISGDSSALLCPRVSGDLSLVLTPMINSFALKAKYDVSQFHLDYSNAVVSDDTLLTLINKYIEEKENTNVPENTALHNTTTNC